MNHTDALQTFAAEKYLLNELPAPLRDEFEDHIFECQECAMDVRAGMAFIGQASTELQCAPQSAAAKRRSFFSILVLPLAGALVTAMAAVVVYQNAVTLPRLRTEVAVASAPAALPATSLIGGATRGAEMPSATVSNGQPLFLYVDVPTDDQFSSYRLAFYDPAGSRTGTIPVSLDQAKNTLLVRLPATGVHNGIYTLAVEGMPGGDKPAVKLAQYRFRVLNGN
jgi:anti-sigma factor RsiW